MEMEYEWQSKYAVIYRVSLNSLYTLKSWYTTLQESLYVQIIYSHHVQIIYSHQFHFKNEFLQIKSGDNITEVN